MEIENKVYCCIEEIIGLSKEEFLEYQDIHLLDSGILDSLCLVSFMDSLSAVFGQEININSFVRSDFASINVFINKMKEIVQNQK